MLSRRNWVSRAFGLVHTRSFAEITLDGLMKRTSNEKLVSFVREHAENTGANKLFLCEGTQSEFETLCEMMVAQGTLTKLKRPGSYLARSDPLDVARVEDRTFIASRTPREAGPTNYWRHPDELRPKLKNLFASSMRNRTMYIVPFSMGPVGSPFSIQGIQLTDSAYVAASMKIMTRMGADALNHISGIHASNPFVPCLHSVGAPLRDGEKDSSWPCDRDGIKFIAHFPDSREIWSYGSGYGGNALLGKKCLALRIASTIARDEGWLAEHMLIVGITNPQGEKKYVAAAFPSACGKTNLAMLNSKVPGWKFETVGDDIAWMRVDPHDGRLWAVNPEYGFFGVAPGTSEKTNPHAIKTIEKNTLFTNVALTPDGDVWWEGMTTPAPDGSFDWKGVKRSANDGKGPLAHPNARFTVQAQQCPVLDQKAFASMSGVPIDAILFGGRRSRTVPLVFEARSWQHGVFLGASMRSETTAAAAGALGVLRHDPFAMLPFAGYNMGHYFGHWLSVGKKMETKKQPRIFHVNWFRRDATSNSFLWPGFGDNARVLQWVFDRCNGKADAKETSIGLVPPFVSSGHRGINVSGLDLSLHDQEELVKVDNSEWVKEAEELRHFFASTIGSSTPKEMLDQVEELHGRASGLFGAQPSAHAA
ncbi:mitochondrial phosphoenolpyruvate carboxykinase GTP [Andalucia godoyi]|uniref:phosphoenolpyruvate carboxykinase (GTP) n=1 Tax=Andalucia godoyi TaxID=505711 RepID=A0A8K0AID2_ANDGO|nr:mitochondrial phosphoenolpyruvate carboxykinase GTP [Andalucia godoyi]|eukprot:ANDGO_02826.mRNA.1 mitochondrial phosphoenolpyruvate carboxykinase GTP